MYNIPPCDFPELQWQQNCSDILEDSIDDNIVPSSDWLNPYKYYIRWDSGYIVLVNLTKWCIFTWFDDKFTSYISNQYISKMNKCII